MCEYSSNTYNVKLTIADRTFSICTMVIVAIVGVVFVDSVPVRVSLRARVHVCMCLR